MADDLRNTPETEDLENAQPEEEQVEKIDLGASLRKEHKQKKPINRVAVLIALAVFICVAAVLAIVLPKVLKQDDPLVADTLTVNLSDHVLDDIVSIKVESDDSTFKITKDSSAVYHIDALSDDKINQGTCSSAFTNAAMMPADQLVESDATDFAKYGLDAPTSILTIEYTDETLVLELGDVLSVTNQIYCRVQGQSDVYVLRAYFANIFGGSILRYRGLTIAETSVEITEINSIIIRQSGQEQVRFMPVQDPASYASGTWKMTEPTELWLDSGTLSELIDYIGTYKLYGYEGQFDDLSQFGLDDPWFSVVLSDVNGVKRTLHLGDELEGESRYYCAIDDSGEVFTISDSYLDFAENFQVATYLDSFANIVSITVVDKLTVATDNKTYEMTIQREEQFDEDGNLMVLANGSTNYLETFRLDGVEQQESAFKTTYSSIIGVTISNLVDKAVLDETKKPFLTVTYTFNNGQEPLVVEYLPYDINNYAVHREGKTELICKKDQVEAIITTLEDLQAGRLDKEEE